MTKAAICAHCMDIVSPRRDWRNDRSWRWCECEHMGVRWRDGSRGHLEVTALHGHDAVQVLGMNNMYLMATLGGTGTDGRTEEQWRELHDSTCSDVDHYYLFHKARRNCWALIVRIGETGDVTFVPYRSDMKTSPDSSADRAAAS